MPTANGGKKFNYPSSLDNSQLRENMNIFPSTHVRCNEVRLTRLHSRNAVFDRIESEKKSSGTITPSSPWCTYVELEIYAFRFLNCDRISVCGFIPLPFESHRTQKQHFKTFHVGRPFGSGSGNSAEIIIITKWIIFHRKSRNWFSKWRKMKAEYLENAESTVGKCNIRLSEWRMASLYSVPT